VKQVEVDSLAEGEKVEKFGLVEVKVVGGVESVVDSSLQGTRCFYLHFLR
jgi:hypothetical protein